MEELRERLSTVYACRTAGELRQPFSDLPGPSPRLSSSAETFRRAALPSPELLGQWLPAAELSLHRFLRSIKFALAFGALWLFVALSLVASHQVTASLPSTLFLLALLMIPLRLMRRRRISARRRGIGR